ncbi:hypothetical protein V3Q90_14920 [Flavobacterium oreochromis]|uniref:hypothetical protein n=1 Tax=Flavobacterium TaxID=237 RepID=UPI000B5B8D35|nr:hypothetical protein B0A56_00545 [Flavobacterium columnare NBRC 100251 = ATCC 23463]POR25429.1 hypothetical protein BWK58_06375 [Flavobacterium columnare]
MSVVNRKLGAKRNTLYRYQLVLDELSQHNTEDIPMTVIWRKHIYPKFGISMATLYTILNTPVKKEMQKVEMAQQQQLSLFH